MWVDGAPECAYMCTVSDSYGVCGRGFVYRNCDRFTAGQRLKEFSGQRSRSMQRSPFGTFHLESQWSTKKSRVSSLQNIAPGKRPQVMTSPHLKAVIFDVCWILASKHLSERVALMIA